MVCMKYMRGIRPIRNIKNDTNIGPLASRIIGINKLNCSDDDIIFLIDGDDWLIHDNVFQYIVDIYQKEDILLTMLSGTNISLSES